MLLEWLAGAGLVAAAGYAGDKADADKGAGVGVGIATAIGAAAGYWGESERTRHAGQAAAVLGLLAGAALLAKTPEQAPALLVQPGPQSVTA